MALQMKITPKFNVKEIIDSTIRKDWFIFQAKAFELGQKAHAYMINYIKTHKHRVGGEGLLEGSIHFYPITGAVMVGWGVGLISELPKYWYVVNYGKKVTGEDFVPGMGKIRPVVFSDGDADPNKRGAGTGQMWTLKRITGANELLPSKIRPLNYIQATRARFNANLRNLLLKLKGSK